MSDGRPDENEVREEIEREIAEATEKVRGSIADLDDHRYPYRIQLNFTGTSDQEESPDNIFEIMDAVIEEARRRGLFFEWDTLVPMKLDKVIVGSDLYKSVTGKVR